MKLTIRPTATKPYTASLHAHAMSPLATEADVVKAISNTTPLVLPTTDPLVAGAIWNNAGTITVSAG